MALGILLKNTALVDQTKILYNTAPAFPIFRRGAVIEGPVEGEKLQTLQICRQLGNFRPPDIQLQALLRICGLPLGRVYIARCHNTIVGYIAFHKPDDEHYWGFHDSLVEMGAIEVSEKWRRCHIATDLLQYIFDHSIWGKYIVIGFHCYRHWDLKGTNLSLWQYRDMLHRLMTRVDFMPAFTTLYDIAAHPANMLMARRGAQVSGNDWLLFKEIAASF
ncbi:acetoin utilization protein AcuA [Desulfotomaculum arcticum]|uniref:Acetoin utilization protein AcuA n=1 Tax=Desulfotruncus arcticus DSM 17038 TaxID=1121424 RepID=A0A1I2QDE9_9FIRM|nr:GNAT family N-acetyltransferase [Desulfotruncus arcticus]SFG25970.1 acetoin utilization protein AcuA [Desulfotomaculum arcticum] [Desulfotruncus arcticus DSM 17038]